MDKAQILVASNRGPVSFSIGDDGAVKSRRGGGGLVSGLSSVATEIETLWVCAALSDADRKAAAAAPEGRLDKAGYDVGGASVRMLNIPADVFNNAYNSVANSTLWFVHHMLYDTPNKPSFGSRFRAEWEDYRAYNSAFAEALLTGADEGAKVAVRTTTWRWYRKCPGTPPRPVHRPLLPHPWAPRVLPDASRGHRPGTPRRHARRRPLPQRALGRRVPAVLRSVLRAPVNWGTRTVEHGGRVIRVGVHGLGADAQGLGSGPPPKMWRAGGTAVERVGDRKLIVRVDRTELSKNIVRGLEAFGELLRKRPEWRNRVTHLAFAYPSRSGVAEYRAYTESVRATAEAINAEFGTDDWTPVVLEVNDDYPRSSPPTRSLTCCWSTRSATG